MQSKNGFDPETGEWNDSLTGEFLWNNTNIGETISDTLTSLTWSMISASFEQMNIMPEYPVIGNLAGRAYNNTSVLVSGMQALGRDLEDLFLEMGGIREEYLDNLDRMQIPLPKPAILPLLVRVVKMRFKQQAAAWKIPRFLDENQNWCRDIRKRISQINDRQTLAELFTKVTEPYARETFWMVISSAWRYGEVTGKLRKTLTSLVGLEQADKLLSNVSTDSELLMSLGPAIGISKVARGELTPEAYLEQWGHRGPHETEISTPRPGEDPDWLSKQLEALAEAPSDAEALLARRQEAFKAAWQDFQERYPHQCKQVELRLEEAAKASRVREAVRSELVRILWVSRDWALRAGTLTGLGEDIFHLTMEEVVDLLLGNPVPVESIPARRRTYARYKSLPPYPMVIRGRFDPFAWAEDPNRRTDYYDESGLLEQIWAESGRLEPAIEQPILGAPGSAGVVEGRVRRLLSPEEGHSLQAGEILVTTQTNIGWSHLFPLAGAVVTDVGAALSHAAIVAREMGIPAVVNCGDATMRLHTGDQVRVDGGRGIVEIIHQNEVKTTI
jgi:pyruvate,water dikinase